MSMPYERMYFVDITNEYGDSDTLEIMAGSEKEARAYAQEELDDMNRGPLNDCSAYRIVEVR